MSVDDVTPADMRAEADRLDAEAAVLERQAAERYAERGGISQLSFARSLDTADRYRREAKALRIDARDYRRVADHMEATGSGGHRPDRGDPPAGEQKEVPEWLQRLNDALRK